MKLLNNNNNSHLHIDKQNPIEDWLVRSMKTAQAGTINLNVGGQQAMKIHITGLVETTEYHNSSS
jgi:hypothetical protein